MDLGIVLGLCAVFLILLLIFLYYFKDFEDPKGLILKMLLSTAFVAMALYACRDNLWDSVYIIIGLILCWFGDYALARFRMTSLKEWNYFILGVTFFAVAQIFYILHVSQHMGMFPFIALILAMVMTLGFVVLNRDTQSKSPVARYTVLYTFLMSASMTAALTAMFYNNFTTASIIYFVGMLLFFLSDAIIYGLVFKKYDYKQDIFNKVFYFVGQLLIVVSLFP